MSMFEMYKRYRKFKKRVVIFTTVAVGAAVVTRAILNKKKEQESQDEKESESLDNYGFEVFDELDKSMELNESVSHDDDIEQIKLLKYTPKADDELLDFLNTASIKELKDIKGVGNITAKRLLDARPILTLDELKEIPRLPNSVFELLNKPH